MRFRPEPPLSHSGRVITERKQPDQRKLSVGRLGASNRMSKQSAESLLFFFYTEESGGFFLSLIHRICHLSIDRCVSLIFVIDSSLSHRRPKILTIDRLFDPEQIITLPPEEQSL
jgi:hypothetical protein